jgi:hypothetical protein
MQLPENFSELVNEYMASLAGSMEDDMPEYPILFGAMVAAGTFVAHNTRMAKEAKDYRPSELDAVLFHKTCNDMCGAWYEVLSMDDGLRELATERYKAIRLVASKCMECGGSGEDD